MSIQEKDDPITQNTPLSQSGKLEIDNEYHRQCPPQHVAKVESRRAKLIPPQHRRMFSESRRAKLIPPHSGVTGRPAISHELPFPVFEIAVGAVRLIGPTPLCDFKKLQFAKTRSSIHEMCDKQFFFWLILFF